MNLELHEVSRKFRFASAAWVKNAGVRFVKQETLVWRLITYLGVKPENEEGLKNYKPAFVHGAIFMARKHSKPGICSKTYVLLKSV